MASILIHCSRPEDAGSPITGFAFTIEYDQGKQVRFADLAIPPSSDANSLGAFRQELRRLGTAILEVAGSGTDIHWNRSDKQRCEICGGARWSPIASTPRSPELISLDIHRFRQIMPGERQLHRNDRGISGDVRGSRG